jgi:hypothetical protein
MKSEIKIEFSKKEELKKLIKKAYSYEEKIGKLLNKNVFIEVNNELDDNVYGIIKGLNNATIKISNDDIIDGNFRFLIDDTSRNPKLYPISIYYILDDNDRYIFF